MKKKKPYYFQFVRHVAPQPPVEPVAENGDKKNKTK